jgi:hypothetical protein
MNAAAALAVCPRVLHRAPMVGADTRRNTMRGYVAQRRGRFDAVIYKGQGPDHFGSSGVPPPRRATRWAP